MGRILNLSIRHFDRQRHLSSAHLSGKTLPYLLFHAVLSVKIKLQAMEHKLTVSMEKEKHVCT
jgi:hypothetical protein